MRQFIGVAIVALSLSNVYLCSAQTIVAPASVMPAPVSALSAVASAVPANATMGVPALSLSAPVLPVSVVETLDPAKVSFSAAPQPASLAAIADRRDEQVVKPTLRERAVSAVLSAALTLFSGQEGMRADIALSRYSDSMRAPAPRVPPAVPVADGSAARVLLPGKGLSPQISDPGRVRLILKIIADVYAGNPLPYRHDGSVFTNVEGGMPAKPLGYYREYTVLPAPGSTMTVKVGDRTFQISPPQGHRGAERIIIGAGGELYYSPDHYRTYIQLEVLR
ncbi:MAG: hypothetical protein NTX64_10365 [Elusimicrobia bacterium]|nr:hypothetical protein [Elusimicrobiota bacterium]